jgi:hypothetical protein
MEDDHALSITVLIRHLQGVSNKDVNVGLYSLERVAASGEQLE